MTMPLRAVAVKMPCGRCPDAFAPGLRGGRTVFDSDLVPQAPADVSAEQFGQLRGAHPWPVSETRCRRPFA